MRIPIIGIFLIYVVGLLIDYYIFCDIKKRAKSRYRALYLKIYGVTTVAFFIYVTVTLCAPRNSENLSLLPIMWALYSCATIYIGKLIYLICSLIGRIFARIPGAKNHGIPVGVVLGLCTFCSFWYGTIVTRHRIVVNNLEIASNRVPKDFHGFKILQFSDAHVGTWGSDTTFVSRLVDSINAQKPDLILFTGDIVNRQTSELAPFLKVFKRLSATNGVYSVLGNHDYGNYIKWNNPGEQEANNILLASWESQMGWNLLNNDHRYIYHGSDSIAIIGVENWGEPPFPQLGDLAAAYPTTKSGNSLNDSVFKVLMTHNPVHWDKVVTKTSNVDLSLAGHTHAMQVMFKIGDHKWSPAALKYKRWGGLYKADKKPIYLYVNIGAGEVGFPARIGAAYPEITTFTLKHSENE